MLNILFLFSAHSLVRMPSGPGKLSKEQQRGLHLVKGLNVSKQLLDLKSPGPTFHISVREFYFVFCTWLCGV